MNSLYNRFPVIISICLYFYLSSSAQEKHIQTIESSSNISSIVLEKIMTLDSIVSIDTISSKMRIEIFADKPFFYRLYFPELKYRSDDFICDGNLSITVLEDFGLSYSQNITNDRYQTFRANILNPFRMALTQLTTTLDYITSLNDSLSLSAFSKAQNEVVKFYSPILNKFSEEEKHTVIGLYNLMYRKKNYNKSEREAIINQFPKSLRSHEYAQYFLSESKISSEVASVGETIEIRNLTDIYGEAMSFEDFSEPYILLDFWGTWCQPCIKSIPTLRKINEMYKNKVAIVSIACNEVGKTDDKFFSFISKHKMLWSHIRYTSEEQKKEGTLPQSVKVSSYPTWLLITKSGKIIYSKIGYSEESEAELSKVLEVLN